MGDYAASGGYYISCAADTIFADQNTLTGSIGVFLMYPEVSKLLKEKLGVGIDSITTNKYTATNSFFMSLNDDETAKMEAYTDYLYRQFLSRVASSRGMTVDQVHSIGEGRIWTAEDALTNNLIDEIGNLEQTIQAVTKRLNLEDYGTIRYPKIAESPILSLLDYFSQNVSIGQQKHSATTQAVEDIIKKLNMSSDYMQPMAKIPDIQWL